MHVRHHVDRNRPSRPLRRRRLCTALAAALACAATLPAAADEILWNGSQSQDWFDGLNWTPAAPPAPDDDAVIDTNQPNGPNVIGAAALLRDLTVGRSGSATLQIAGVGGVSSRVGRIGEFEGSLGAVVVAGAGSVWSNSQNLFVGLGGTGSLNVINGGQVFSDAAGIGQQQGSDGSVLVSGPGSAWVNTASLIVGGDGSGTLFIINGGAVNNGQARVGQGGSGQGAALVSGAGSTWTSAGALVIGNSGGGSMEILDGGAVVSTSGTVGNLNGSVGEVVVEGPGSHWSMASDLMIGAQGGTGTLRVQDGGAVFSDAGSLGHFGGSGTATLTGIGSNWIMTGDLTVGRAGIGVLDIAGGAAVASVGGTIGELSDSTGVVAVSGAGSVWDYGGTLVVGGAGNGALAIANGGQVINGGPGNALLAAEAGSTGTVVVGDAGSGWDLGNGGLYVGFAGSGTMWIEDGAAVSNGFAMIGGETGSPGTMTVSGGSQWASSANIVVGSAGAVDVDGASVVTGASFGFIDGTVSLDGASQFTLGGNLLVRDGGALRVRGGSVVAANTSQVDGEASVAGAGSGLNLTANLFVGQAGSGSLVVSDGAQVDNVQGNVGLFDGSEGSVLVTGAGSTWNNTSSIRVAQTGTGTVRVEDGGRLISAGGMLAQQADAEGAVTVHGAGSTWLNSAELFVAWGGAGTLAIEAGGAVTSSLAEIGTQAGSQGTVTVDGPDSTWTSLGPLTIGEQGSGSLAVRGGGLVTSGSGMIGHREEADGRVQLEGAGTHWSIGSSLTVGSEGAGALEIAGGATLVQIAGDGIVGDFNSGSGEVLVTGAGSRWDSPGSLFVGRAGSGTLAVLDGAQVTNVGGAIGASAGAEGAVLVSGAGSLWAASAQYAVGGDGTGTLSIADGGAVHSDVAILGASAGGAGHAVVTGTGSLWQSQSSLTVGGGGSGTLIIEEGGTVATGSFSWVGNQAGSEGTVIVRGAGSLWNPDSFITLGRGGTGTLTVAGDGAVATGGALFFAQQAGAGGTLNFGAGAGEEAAAPGTLQASVIMFGDGEATLNFNHTQADYGFLTPMTSAGGGVHAIAHLAGTTILGGDSSGFSGTTTVSGGTLAVDGTLGGTLYVEGSGVLAGTGTVGTTTVAAGGTLAPGASIGTLTVDGDVTFAPGSRFEVELDVGGTGDLLAVTGTATLDGGAVAALPVAGIAIDTPYTILTGAGGVAGTFDSMTLDSPSAFLAPTLTYEPQAVVLRLLQGASFASVALTPNQAAAGAGADSLGNGHPVWDAVVMLGEDDARDAFDALSGEIHASTLGALVDESRYIREAAHARLYAAGDADAPGFWARALGDSGRIDGDGNAARLDRSTAGLFLGGDLRVGDGWRLGAALGHHRASHDADARRSSADVHSTHLAAYAGRHWGASALRLGAAHAWHRIDVDRQVAFTGHSEALQARYDAGTLQVFGEYGYGIERGDFTWEPFAALAWVQVDGDRFDEGTGAAALSGDGGTHDATIATLGVRLAGRIDAGQASPATVHGMLGWQRGFGDTTPRVRSAFAGGDPFVVAGAPAGGAAVIEAGLGFALGASTRMEVSYAGRFGSDLRENAVLATFTADF